MPDLRADPSARPQAYWINSSGNSLVRRFVHLADKTTKSEIERLIAGEAVEKAVRLELTYDEIDNSIDNIWSVLFMTGYLTSAGEAELPDGGGSVYKLVIPNWVFIFQIREWFNQAVAQIRERRYDELLREDGREDILAYGIAFRKKRCMVVCERL